MSIRSYICPVCGFPELSEKPHGENTGGSYEICPSCGFQFGVSDDDKGFTYESWRVNWIKNGMRWSSLGMLAPEHWDPKRQLKEIGIEVNQKITPSK